MEIKVITVPDKPDYKPLARHLNDRIIDFYKDPANEADFRAWKKERDEKERTAG